MSGARRLLRVGTAAVALAAGLAALGACRRASTLPAIGRLSISGTAVVPEADESSLRAAVIAALDRAGFAFRPSESPAALRVRIERVDAGGPLDGLRVKVRLTGHGSSAIHASGYGGPPVSMAAVSAGLDDALHRGRLDLEARLKRDADLVRDLADGDPRVRDYAVRALAERKNPIAVPALIRALDDRDPEVVLRAVGALVAIGDRRAVGPLIDLTTRKSGPFVAQIAQALGAIGGEEAEAYLFTLQQGHADEEVRRAAAQALDSLRRGRTAAASEPAAPPVPLSETRKEASP